MKTLEILGLIALGICIAIVLRVLFTRWLDSIEGDDEDDDYDYTQDGESINSQERGLKDNINK